MKRLLAGLDAFLTWANSKDKEEGELQYDYTLADCVADLMHYIETRTDTTVDVTMDRAKRHFNAEKESRI